MSEFLFRIGSMQYSQQSIKIDKDDEGELFSEIRKCVGVLGNLAYNSWTDEETLKIGLISVEDGPDFTTAIVACTTYRGREAHGTTNRRAQSLVLVGVSTVDSGTNQFPHPKLRYVVFKFVWQIVQ